MLLVVATLVAASCQPEFGTDAGPIRYGVLTGTPGLHYAFTTDGSDITATAPAPFPDGNVREVYWTDHTSWNRDQEACSTWDTFGASYDKPIQPGIALRIAPTGANGEGIKAITLTESVWYSAVWIFNVLLWDSTKTGHEATTVAQFDLSPIVGKFGVDDEGNFQSTLVGPPWHVCAAVTGDLFRFKVWTGADQEPTWSDPTHVFSATLPDGWDYPGAAGWYIGHLRETNSATISSPLSNFACADPDLFAMPYCQTLLTGDEPTTTAPSPTVSSTVPSSSTVPTTVGPPEATVAGPTTSTASSVPIPD